MDQYTSSRDREIVCSVVFMECDPSEARSLPPPLALADDFVSGQFSDAADDFLARLLDLPSSEQRVSCLAIRKRLETPTARRLTVPEASALDCAECNFPDDSPFATLHLEYIRADCNGGD